jgi:hypothetical protein
MQPVTKEKLKGNFYERLQGGRQCGKPSQDINVYGRYECHVIVRKGSTYEVPPLSNVLHKKTRGPSKMILPEQQRRLARREESWRHSDNKVTKTMSGRHNPQTRPLRQSQLRGRLLGKQTRESIRFEHYWLLEIINSSPHPMTCRNCRKWKWIDHTLKAVDDIVWNVLHLNTQGRQRSGRPKTTDTLHWRGTNHCRNILGRGFKNHTRWFCYVDIIPSGVKGSLSN